MATSQSSRGKRRSKRIGDLQQEAYYTPRRSQRLSQKYGHTPTSTFPLLVSARPSINSYKESHESSLISNVLNESGQSVPSNFDDDQSTASSIDESLPGAVQHDHPYSRGQEYSYYNVSSGFTSTPVVYSSNVGDFDLYGCDHSDNEGNNSDAEVHSSREFNLFTKEKTITPMKQTPSTTRSKSFTDAVIGFFYCIGSFIYLFLNLIFCWDVAVLHRSGQICRDSSGRRPFYGFLMLLGVFFLLALCLIVPHAKFESVPYPPMPASTKTITTTIASIPTTTETPLPTPSEDSSKLLSLLKRLQRDFEDLKNNQSVELNNMKKDFESFVEDYINKHETLTSLPGQFEKFQSDLEKRLNTEQTKREDEVIKLKTETESYYHNNLEQAKASFEKKLQDLLVEVRNMPVPQPGGLNETQVQVIVQDLVDKAITILRSQLDEKDKRSEQIREQDKTEAKKALQEAYNKLEKTITELGTTLESNMQQSSAKIENLSSDIGATKINFESKIGELSLELKDLANTVHLLENRVKALEKGPPGLPPPPSDLNEEYILRLINNALYNYSADQIVRFDFALESAGGSVVDSSTTFDSSRTRPKLFGITLPITLSRSTPNAIIQPSVLPGDCWCFQGTQGHALIKLSSTVIIDAVTLQHIPKELNPTSEITSAPKTFKVLGKKSPDDKGVLLGTFLYKTDSSPIQTFNIDNQKTSYNYVLFQFETNYGNDDFTCVYRVRVHGSLSHH